MPCTLSHSAAMLLCCLPSPHPFFLPLGSCPEGIPPELLDVRNGPACCSVGPFIDPNIFVIHCSTRRASHPSCWTCRRGRDTLDPQPPAARKVGRLLLGIGLLCCQPKLIQGFGSTTAGRKKGGGWATHQGGASLLWHRSAASNSSAAPQTHCLPQSLQPCPICHAPAAQPASASHAVAAPRCCRRILKRHHQRGALGGNVSGCMRGKPSIGLCCIY